MNETQEALKGLVGGQSLLQFVKMNRVLLNALIRSTPNLLEKSLKALVEVKPLRGFLDFDVKRKYFSSLLKRKRWETRSMKNSWPVHPCVMGLGNGRSGDTPL